MKYINKRYLIIVIAQLLLVSNCFGGINEQLIHAAKYGIINVAKSLIGKGANIDAKDTTGGTPLIYASYWNHTKLVELLIGKGANIDAKDNNGWTPLTKAAYKGYTSIAILLINAGANIKVQNNKSNTALDIAREKKHIEIITLLENAQNNNPKPPSTTQSSSSSMNLDQQLFEAAKTNNLTLAKKLIRQGANIQYKDNFDKKTPLHVAGYEVTKLLLLNGADTHAKDTFDNTPWDACPRVMNWKNEATKARLLYNPPSPTYEDVNFAKKLSTQTSFDDQLYFGAKNGNLAQVKKALSLGADIETKGPKGTTPLLFAVSNGHLDVVKFLISLGSSDTLMLSKSRIFPLLRVTTCSPTIISLQSFGTMTSPATL